MTIYASPSQTTLAKSVEHFGEAPLSVSPGSSVLERLAFVQQVGGSVPSPESISQDSVTREGRLLIIGWSKGLGKLLSDWVCLTRAPYPVGRSDTRPPRSFLSGVVSDAPTAAIGSCDSRSSGLSFSQMAGFYFPSRSHNSSTTPPAPVTLEGPQAENAQLTGKAVSPSDDVPRTSTPSGWHPVGQCETAPYRVEEATASTWDGKKILSRSPS